MVAPGFRENFEIKATFRQHTTCIRTNFWPKQNLLKTEVRVRPGSATDADTETAIRSSLNYCFD